MTRPYTRSVFGADTSLGCVDPPSLHFDMGPYAGSPINPHAFASGHQYGAGPGLRGIGPQFVVQSPDSSALQQQLADLEKAQKQIDADTTALEKRVAAMNAAPVSDPSGKPAVVVTPTVPVIPAQTAVTAVTGPQTLTVGPAAPAPARVSRALVLAGVATGVLIVVLVRRRKVH